MYDGTPELSVGFAIDTGGSFDALTQLAAVMDSTEAKIVREARAIEQATGGMINLGGATASISAFGSAATRGAQDAARALAQAEKAGESLSRQLDRQNASFGKTREEMRATKVEAAALAAEQQGLTELAGRLRSQEASLYAQEFAAARQARLEAEAAAEAKVTAAAEAVAAAEREAQAARSAMAAYQMFNAVAKQKMAAYNDQQAVELQREAAAARQAADEHARLAAIVRGSHDAQEADAVAAERLRESTDSVYAATKRVNAQIAESTRLYHAGATAPAEYARQQQVLNTRLLEETGVLANSTRGHQAHASASGLSRNASMELTHVLKASAEQMAMGAPPLQILTTHLGQLGQIASMTEGGVKGLALAVAGMVAPFTAVIVPLAIVAGVAFGAFKQFQSQVKDSGELTRYRDSLGLTHKELLELGDGVEKVGDKFKKLDDVTVSAGDVMAGLWKTVKDQAGGSVGAGLWDKLKSGASDALGWIIEQWNIASAQITSAIFGTANAGKLIWGNFATSVGDVFYQAVNLAIGAMNTLVKTGTDILNGFVHAANKVPGVKIGDFNAPQIGPVTNPYEGKASAAASADTLKQIKKGYSDFYDWQINQDKKFWATVGKNAIQHHKDTVKEQADALKEGRTDKKPNDHGLGNALKELDAQIKGQWALAAAYQVSDAEAMKAEARLKAEQQAIRHKGDLEIFYAKELDLAVAQAAAEGAKHIADLTAQAGAQKEVNDAVAAGTIPASQMSQALQEVTERRRLDAALAIAEQNKQLDQVVKLKGELANLGRAQADANAQANRAQVLSASASGADQLAKLQLEARLIGATNEQRAVAIAQMEAEQFLAAHPGATAAETQKYIDSQVAIARQGVLNTQANDAYNASLTETADHWDIIASKVQAAGQGMADALGNAGKAIGDVASTYANYMTTQSRLDAEHQARVKAAGSNQILLAQETQRYALQSSGSQIAAYGDMLGAAKGFFKEGTAGYEALGAAEKVYRVAQLAFSVQAMLQQVRETITHVASSAARSTANASEGISAQAKLPFPFNLVAMAATAAALVAAGIAVFGGSGSSTSHVDPGNTGTGTVLGNSTAGSDSIKNAINDLKNVDLLTNTYSRQMAASLKSIDSQIGSFAAEIVKGGDINASANIATGFKTSGLGSLLSNIPLIGGFLSSLFGTRTDITGSGLYGSAQTIGQVMNSGYTGQSYSDVERTHKFFGIVTGRDYSTSYGSLDPSINTQFTLILQSFDKAIAAAAGPLGQATDAVQSKLSGFIVDIGKIDLQGLSGDEIEKKLENVFGALGDKMASFVFPDITQFQKVGEGALETLVRVSSTVESVTTALDELGKSTADLGISAKLGLADQFDSLSDMSSAVDAYFQAYYTSAEQAAAKTAQMTKVFGSLGLAVPSTLAAFRQLVEAQDLTTAAGQSTYATLLQLAPAFADLQSSMTGAKSAADIVSERQDLQRQLLELQGNTAAVRALDLAKVDDSNKALQQAVWAAQDAKDLADAWKSVGDTILDEINRIRGLNTVSGNGSFASLLGQFNAATAAARGGDQTAAKNLPQLSQALLTAAADAASSRQELDRIQAQTASSLQQTYDAINAFASTVTASTTAPTSNAALLSAAATSTAASAPAAAANDDTAVSIADLRDELEATRRDLTAALATIAGNTGKSAKILDTVTADSGGTAVSVASAA